MARTDAEIRGELRAEREQLAEAVEDLRGELGRVAATGRKVRAGLPFAAGGAAALGAVVRFLLARRRRDAATRRR